MNALKSFFFKFNPYLSAITFIALLLRLIYLNQVPNGFHSDEVSIGYEAYSILKTCKDEHGVLFPLYFKAFGEYKNPVFIYTVVPFIKVFGLNIFAVRFATAIYGTLTVFFTYLLCKELFNKKIGLCAAFLLAICPWHLHFSRIAYEAISFPAFFTIGFYFLVKGLHKRRYMVYSAVILAITFYTYSPAKLLVPIFLLGFLALNYKTLFKFKKELIISLIAGCLILVPLLIFTIKGKGQTRFNTISIFTSNSLHKTKDRILNDIYWAPSFCKKFVDNKKFLISYSFIKNYISHFSLDFLFFKGDTNPRHSVGKMGQLYQFEGILIILGIIFILIKRKRENLIILWWLLIFPISSSLTNDGVPHAIRSIYGLPSFQIIAGFAIYSSYNYIRFLNSATLKFRKYLTPFIILLSITLATFAAFNIKSYFTRYFKVYPLINYSAWRYDMRELVLTVDKMKNIDDFSFIGTRDPYIFLLFYTKYDPKKWQESRTFERYKIGSFSRNIDKKQAIVVKPGKHKKAKTINTVKYPNGSVCYEIKEVTPINKDLTPITNVKNVNYGGLEANYYNGTKFNKLVFSRIDKSIDFNWMDGSPSKDINNDGFSITWNGLIKIDKTEIHKFYTYSDDGVRLFINDQLIIDNWSKHRATETVAKLNMAQGLYKIRLEYNEIHSSATLKLSWSSNSINKRVIPPENLAHVSSQKPQNITADNVNWKGIKGNYFNGKNFENLVLSQIDKSINFDWGKNAPVPGVNKDNFSVKWHGLIKIDKSSIYTFYTQSDDGVRLFINNNLIIHNWTWHRLTENSATIYLDKGIHEITLEYNDISYGAKIELLWSTNPKNKEVVPSSNLGYYIAQKKIK